MDPVRHLKISVFVLLLLLSFGTAGYMLIEGWDGIDSLYMTVITLSTVGFREVHNLDDAGKIFTMALIFSGVGVIGYIVGSLAQIMFEGQFHRIIGRRKVEKAIDALCGHYIICGYGRIGALICREFAAKPLPFVVVEKDAGVIERMEGEGHNYLCLRGDATSDDTLLRAGIRRAKGLVSVVTSDTENVYITLTARGLNSGLYILARSSEEGSEIKLKRAGATKVVSPYLIGGSRMAQAILRPNVVDFIEIATGREHLELQMEEILIPESSGFVGESLASSGFRKETGVIIVGIKYSEGTMRFNPESHTKIEADATLILLGESAAIQKLEQLIASGAGVDDLNRKYDNE